MIADKIMVIKNKLFAINSTGRGEDIMMTAGK